MKGGRVSLLTKGEPGKRNNTRQVKLKPKQRKCGERREIIIGSAGDGDCNGPGVDVNYSGAPNNVLLISAKILLSAQRKLCDKVQRRKKKLQFRPMFLICVLCLSDILSKYLFCLNKTIFSKYYLFNCLIFFKSFFCTWFVVNS